MRIILARVTNNLEGVIRMSTIRELTNLRTRLLRDIDESINEMIRKLERGEQSTGNGTGNISRTMNEDQVYPLSSGPALFKGKKPSYVVFGREKVIACKWKTVFQEVMERCNADPVRHRALMNLRDRVTGRSRIILSDRPAGMRSPLKIDHKLYVETHYDTENLMRLLLYKLLDAVGYDYSDITVVVRDTP